MSPAPAGLTAGAAPHCLPAEASKQMHQGQLCGMAVALRRVLLWTGTRGVATWAGLEGSRVQVAEPGLAREGRGEGNLLTSPSCAAVLLLILFHFWVCCPPCGPGSTEWHSCSQ